MSFSLGIFLIFLFLINNRLIYDTNNLIVLLCCLIIIINTIGTFVYLRKDKENEEYEARLNINEQMINNQIKYIDQMTNNYKELRLFKHDVNSYLNAIDQLIINQNYEELEKLIKETRELTQSTVFNHCTNIYISATLNQFVNLIKEYNIVFSFNYDVFTEIKMKNVYICSLFYNLMKNAIESNLKCDDSRMIKLSLEKKYNSLVIEMENAISKDFKMDYINQMITSKANIKDHGLGLINIKRVIEEYHGDIIYEMNGNILITNIILVNVF